MSIKAIIFDFGGVIIDLHFDRMRKAFSALGLRDFDAYFTKLKQHPILDLLDKGEISPEQFRHEFQVLAGIKVSDSEFDHAWNSILGEIPPHRLEFITKLAETYRIFLLSNTNAIHKPVFDQYVLQKYGKQGIGSYFEKAYFSHEIHARKPEPEIFKLVIEENSLEPASTLFVDDSPQHVAAAAALGIKACHLLDGQDVTTTIPQWLV